MEGTPSRRNNVPSSPGLVQASAFLRTESLYSTVKPRRRGLSETSGLGTEDEPPGLAPPDDVATILEEGPSLRPASLRSAVLRSGPSSKIATPVPLKASLCSFIFPFLSALRV